jgi:hypothetical protein
MSRSAADDMQAANGNIGTSTLRLLLTDHIFSDDGCVNLTAQTIPFHALERRLEAFFIKATPLPSQPQPHRRATEEQEVGRKFGRATDKLRCRCTVAASRQRRPPSGRRHQLQQPNLSRRRRCCLPQLGASVRRGTLERRPDKRLGGGAAATVVWKQAGATNCRHIRPSTLRGASGDVANSHAQAESQSVRTAKERPLREF